MLYAITKGNVSQEAADTERIVYLQCTTQGLRAARLPIVASNRHPVRQYASFSDADEDLDREDFIDWPLMRDRYWNNTLEDPDRVDRRQAEILVYNSVPWAVVESVGVKTERAAQAVRAQLSASGATTPVHVRGDWYF